MKFWDSSALVPLYYEEPSSRSCRDLVRSDPAQVVWSFAVTEVTSALCRRSRQGHLDGDRLRRAEEQLARMASKWFATPLAEVPTVRGVADHLLHRYALRTADALQLAAALIAFDRKPLRRGFVSLDDGLLAAAAAEGFDAIRPAERRRSR